MELGDRLDRTIEETIAKACEKNKRSSMLIRPNHRRHLLSPHLHRARKPIHPIQSTNLPYSSSANPAQHSENSSYTLLASCMHAGSRIVQLSRCGDEWEFAVLAKFEEHKSMNYGSDVQLLVGGSGVGGRERQRRVIVSTSFYDRLMCVWGL